MKTPAGFLCWSGSRPHAKATFHWLLLLLVVAWLLRRWVWMPVLIVGTSMIPSFPHGHLVSLNKMAYWYHPPQRGDVVVFWTGKELLAKRVIALPGEVAAVTNGSVYIDGRLLQEPYVAFRNDANIAPGRLPPGLYLMAGDNRQDSVFELVRADRIVGRERTIDSFTAH